MFKNLKREVVYKSTIGKEIVKAFLSAVLFTWLVCLCLTDFNHEIVDFFLTFHESNINMIEFAILVLPIFIILFMSMHFGRLIMLDTLPKENNKEVKKVIKKKKISKK